MDEQKANNGVRNQNQSNRNIDIKSLECTKVAPSAPSDAGIAAATDFAATVLSGQFIYGWHILLIRRGFTRGLLQ